MLLDLGEGRPVLEQCRQAGVEVDEALVGAIARALLLGEEAVQGVQRLQHTQQVLQLQLLDIGALRAYAVQRLAAVHDLEAG